MIKTIRVNGRIRLKDISELINIKDINIWRFCNAWFKGLDITIEDIKRHPRFSTGRNTIVCEAVINKKLRYLIVQYRGHQFFVNLVDF